MSGKNNSNFKRRAAAALAIIIALAMILSVVAPVLSAVAFGATKTTVEAQAVAKHAIGEETNSLQTVAPKEIDDGRFSIKAEIGFENKYIVNKTTPFKFIVTNNGEAFKGQLQLKIYLFESSESQASQYAIFYVPVELAKNATKEISMEAQVSALKNFFSVTLVDEKENTVFLKNYPVTAKDPQSVWTGVLSDNPSELVYIKQNDSHYNEEATYYYGVDYFNTFYLSENNFPQSKNAMDNFRTIIINDFNTTSLNEKQITALKTWVENGGLLVLGTGVSAQKVLGGLSGIADFKFTSNVSTVPSAGKSITVSDAKMEGAESVVEEEGVVTTSFIKMGNGEIVLHSFDLGKNPIPEITDMAMVLRNIYESIAPENFSVEGDYYESHSGGYDPIQNTAGRMSPVKGVGMDIIFIIIGIYVIVIGPVVYFFLKKKDKREKGWVVIPILAVLTTVLVYALGAGSYYRGSILNLVSRVNVDQGSPFAEAEIYAGVRSGDKGDLSFRADENFNLDISQMDYGYMYGDKEICALKVNASNVTEMTYNGSERWALNNFATSKTIDMGGTLDAEIKLKGNTFSGKITNNTSYELEDLVLDFGSEIIKIDSCMPGETVDVLHDLSSSDPALANNYYDAVEELFGIKNGVPLDTSNEKEFVNFGRFRIIRGITDQASSMTPTAESPMWAKLYAFNKDSLIEGDKYINDKKMHEQNENIFVMDVPISIDTTGKFELPFGFITTSKAVDDNGNPAQGKDNIYVYPEGTTTCTFNLPSGLEASSFKLEWAVQNGYMEQPEIFNVAAQSWEEMSSGEYTDLKTYVAKDGEIKVRAFAKADSEIEKPKISIKGGK